MPLGFLPISCFSCQRASSNLRSQFVISSLWGGRRTAPYAFTEQGVAMLSSVLRSRRAIAVNVEIMRAFVRLREMIAGYGQLRRRIDELEQRTDGQIRSGVRCHSCFDQRGNQTAAKNRVFVCARQSGGKPPHSEGCSSQFVTSGRAWTIGYFVRALHVAGVVPCRCGPRG